MPVVLGSMCSPSIDFHGAYHSGVGRPHAVQRAHAVGHDAERVEVEELGDVDGVVLDLVERLVDRWRFEYGFFSSNTTSGRPLT